MTYEDLLRHLRTECELIEISCAYNCGAIIQRLGRADHILGGSCPGAVVSCIECEVKGGRNAMK